MYDIVHVHVHCIHLCMCHNIIILVLSLSKKILKSIFIIIDGTCNYTGMYDQGLDKKTCMHTTCVYIIPNTVGRVLIVSIY